MLIAGQKVKMYRCTCKNKLAKDIHKKMVGGIYTIKEEFLEGAYIVEEGRVAILEDELILVNHNCIFNNHSEEE